MLRPASKSICRMAGSSVRLATPLMTSRISVTAAPIRRMADDLSWGVRASCSAVIAWRRTLTASDTSAGDALARPLCVGLSSRTSPTLMARATSAVSYRSCIRESSSLACSSATSFCSSSSARSSASQCSRLSPSFFFKRFSYASFHFAIFVSRSSTADSAWSRFSRSSLNSFCSPNNRRLRSLIWASRSSGPGAGSGAGAGAGGDAFLERVAPSAPCTAPALPGAWNFPR
mmetsp:Transcript_25060/g.70172  ORF Transcript_25060/g.70172 Transcript_25060/m.70172 type:complete len:231 (-) Transcript_25060:26-718(-)